MEKVLDAFTTSLTRPQIKYTLMVNRLFSLDIRAMAYVTAERLQTDRLAVKFNGPGLIEIGSLVAEKLALELVGTGRAELAGFVDKQEIVLRGLGQYEAANLESRVAKIELLGPGVATLWATKQLDVSVRGPGSVSYYGAPEVRQRISPMGNLVCLESRSVNETVRV